MHTFIFIAVQREVVVVVVVRPLVLCLLRLNRVQDEVLRLHPAYYPRALQSHAAEGDAVAHLSFDHSHERTVGQKLVREHVLIRCSARDVAQPDLRGNWVFCNGIDLWAGGHDMCARTRVCVHMGRCASCTAVGEALKGGR